MSKEEQSFDYAHGPWHIAIRLKGSPDAIARFHAIMYRCEGDWPWSNTRRTSISVCDKCMGAVCQSPRVTPVDLKSAARQAGCTVKVDKFAPETHCFTETKKYCSTSYIPFDQAQKLTKHKTKFLVIRDRQVMHIDEARQQDKDSVTAVTGVMGPIQPGTMLVN